MSNRRYGALAVLVAAAAVSVVVPAQPAAAVVSVNTVAGWNMQGAASGGGDPNQPPSSNWADQVLGMTNTYSVVALQEAGAVPGSARATGRPLPGTWQVAGAGGPGGVYSVVEYLWNRRYVYHVQVGASPGLRTNLAIVTRQQALSVFMIPPQGALGAGRPSFGVQVPDETGGGTSVFWTVHAQSFGASGALRNDAANIAAQIDWVMRGAGSPAWAAIGDWNRDPETQLFPYMPLTTRTVSTGTATHFGTGQDSELDAMITNDTNLRFTARLAGGPLSDHTPTVFSVR